MFGQRRRRWTNVKPTLFQFVVFARIYHDHNLDIRQWSRSITLVAGLQRNVSTVKCIYSEMLPTAKCIYSEMTLWIGICCAENTAGLQILAEVVQYQKSTNIHHTKRQTPLTHSFSQSERNFQHQIGKNITMKNEHMWKVIFWFIAEHLSQTILSILRISVVFYFVWNLLENVHTFPAV